MKHLFILLITMATFLASCIKSEPLNPEADILKFALPANIMLSDPLFNRAESGVTEILITIPQGENVTALTPEIEITPGASISPEKGVVQDFSKPVTYTVTSQDGNHQRVYRVSLNSYMFKKSDFDNWDIYSNNAGTVKYEVPFEYSSDRMNKIHIWSSSNRGVAIYQQYEEPHRYPVASIQENGKKMAILKTDKGPGNVMGIQYIPVVAGSLFTGSMDLANAIKDPLSSTQFGISCDYLPGTLKGRYSYKAGSGKYIKKTGNTFEELPNVKDSCALYAVFFKVDEELSMLNGNNVLSHPNIVAITEKPHRPSTPGEDLIDFEIPFIYKQGVEVDFSKNRYKLAIIFSSSHNGDLYSGTPGSEMKVDRVEVIPKEGE